MLVEDEHDAQIVVDRLLRHVGVETQAVDSAEDALVALAERPFTAAVIDLALPGMDGLSLVQAIRQQAELRDLPCVAITAYHTSTVREQAMSAGFDLYFPKPLDDRTFLADISRLIETQ